LGGFGQLGRILQLLEKQQFFGSLKNNSWIWADLGSWAIDFGKRICPIWAKSTQPSGANPAQREQIFADLRDGILCFEAEFAQADDGNAPTSNARH
jgi:hypothetical protein